MPRFTDFLTFGGSGELAGATSATRMPDIPARFVKFKAASDNAGVCYIGASGVTVKDGTTDATSGWPLAASEETDFLPCGNIQDFYRICANAGDDLLYLYWR